MSVIKSGTKLHGVRFWRGSEWGKSLTVYEYVGTDEERDIHYFKLYGRPTSVIVSVSDSALGNKIHPFVIEN